MTLEIGLTGESTNTQYAPLAVLAAHYQQHQVFAPLKQVEFKAKKRDFTVTDKLTQIFWSILAGCETLSQVNTKLKSEVGLAAVCGWDRFADQSALSRTLDALTLKQIEHLREAHTAIWRQNSHSLTHDWRSFLWLDFDLSGLPCGKQAEQSQKGYFSGKKTPLDVNWHA